MKKKISYALNILIIVFIGFATIKLLFGDADLKIIMQDLRRAKKEWLILGLAFVIFFIAGESVIIKYMLRMFNVKTPFYQCLKYSFIGFFFSDITPSSSGGQPAQVFYMKRDGIKIGYSSLIMLVVAVTYKAALVVMGIVFYALKRNFIMQNMGDWFWLLIVGFFLNIIYIAGLIIIFYKPLWARKFSIKVVNLLCRIHILKWKNNEKYINKIDRICDNYIKGAEYIKANLHTVLNIFLMTVVQRLFLLSVTYLVYRSYSLTGTSFLENVAIQTMISIAVEMLPLPGAAGITEACFIVMFGGIFGQQYVRTGMLLSRGLSFYFVLIVGGMVTLIAHILSMRKSEPIQGEILNEKK